MGLLTGFTGGSEAVGVADLAVFLGLLILIVAVLAAIQYLRRQ